MREDPTVEQHLAELVAPVVPDDLAEGVPRVATADVSLRLP